MIKIILAEANIDWNIGTREGAFDVAFSFLPDWNIQKKKNNDTTPNLRYSLFLP